MTEIFDENKPIYIQIMDLIKKQMISKELQPGEKLLSVRDMSKQLGVNVSLYKKGTGHIHRR